MDSEATGEMCHDECMTRTLCLAQESEADELLSTDDFALLVGMLLDQQCATRLHLFMEAL